MAFHVFIIEFNDPLLCLIVKRIAAIAPAAFSLWPVKIFMGEEEWLKWWVWCQGGWGDWMEDGMLKE